MRRIRGPSPHFDILTAPSGLIAFLLAVVVFVVSSCDPYGGPGPRVEMRAAQATTGVPKGLDVAGHWAGAVASDDRMEISVDFLRSEHGLTGTSYVPIWGEGVWPLTNITLCDQHIKFSFERNCCSAGIFRGLVIDGKITGTYE